MSQYCNVTDIEAYYLGKTFNAGDYVTNSQVETMIIVESSIIDAVVVKRYGLPVTDHSDLLILKTICEKFVVSTIDDITREKTADGKFERGRNTGKEAQILLDMIEDGKLRFNSSKKASVITFNNLDSAGNEVEKYFKNSNIEPTVTTIDRERRRIVS